MSMKMMRQKTIKKRTQCNT